MPGEHPGTPQSSTGTLAVTVTGPAGAAASARTTRERPSAAPATGGVTPVATLTVALSPAKAGPHGGGGDARRRQDRRGRQRRGRGGGRLDGDRGWRRGRSAGLTSRSRWRPWWGARWRGWWSAATPSCGRRAAGGGADRGGRGGRGGHDRGRRDGGHRHRRGDGVVATLGGAVEGGAADATAAATVVTGTAPRGDPVGAVLVDGGDTHDAGHDGRGRSRYHPRLRGGRRGPPPQEGEQGASAHGEVGQEGGAGHAEEHGHQHAPQARAHLLELQQHPVHGRRSSGARRPCAGRAPTSRHARRRRAW